MYALHPVLKKKGREKNLSRLQKNPHACVSTRMRVHKHACGFFSTHACVWILFKKKMADPELRRMCWQLTRRIRGSLNCRKENRRKRKKKSVLATDALSSWVIQLQKKKKKEKKKKKKKANQH
jgi:hypothetical protein